MRLRTNPDMVIGYADDLKLFRSRLTQVAMIVLLLVFLFLQRWLVQGVEASGLR